MIKYLVSFSNIRSVMMEITDKIQQKRFDSIQFDLSKVVITDDFTKFFNFCIHLIQSKYTKNITLFIKDIEKDTVLLMLNIIKFSGILNKFTFVCIGNLVITKDIEKCYYPDINIKRMDNDYE